MNRKTRRICIAAVAVAVLITAIAIAAFSNSNNSQQKPKDTEQAQEEQQIEGIDDVASAAEWITKSSTDIQKLAAKLASVNWKTDTNTEIVSFNLDGTYTQTSASGSESSGSWRISDFKQSSSSQDWRNCTAVITLDDSPYTLTSRLETANESAAENMTATQYISASGLAGGKQLAETAKDSAFKLLGIGDDLAPYVGDAAAFTEQFASFCHSNVPLAQAAGWNKDLDFDYDKRKAVATFTCNDSRSTKIYASFPLDGGAIYLSTSSSN